MKKLCSPVRNLQNYAPVIARVPSASLTEHAIALPITQIRAWDGISAHRPCSRHTNATRGQLIATSLHMRQKGGVQVTHTFPSTFQPGAAAQKEHVDAFHGIIGGKGQCKSTSACITVPSGGLWVKGPPGVT